MQTATRHTSTGGLAFVLALIGAASMLYYHIALFMPQVERVRSAKHLQGEYSFGNDFYPIWLTSRDWLRARVDPYSEVITQKIQVGLFGRPLKGQYPTDPPAKYRTFAYPAFTDLLFWPLSEIPFHSVRIIWAACLTLALASGVLLWARALSWKGGKTGLAIVVLLTVCSYPGLEGLYAGQLGLLVGTILAASLLAFVRGRLLLAGILMAFTLTKPQMTVIAIFYLLLWSLEDWPRRRRLPVGFFATMLLLVGASLAVWPHWLQSWAQVIRGYPGYSTPPLASEILGAALRARAGNAVIVVLLLAAISLAWRGRKAEAGSQEFWLTLSLLLAITSVAVLPGQSLFDQVILVPGILLVACREERFRTPMARALLAIGSAVLFWPYAAAFGLILLRPFLSAEIFASKAVFVLPLRTAAAFPFLVLGLLVLCARGEIRPAKGEVSIPLSAH